MWHIRKRLTMVAFTEVKAESLANEMRVLDTTVGKMLTLLVERGYLEESGKKKPRAFRLPWSRRAYTERAA
jgi:DNA-binding IclR family transcriptional regulator